MCVSVCVCGGGEGGGGGVHTRYVTGKPRGREPETIWQYLLYGLIVLALQIFNVILVEKN